MANPLSASCVVLLLRVRLLTTGISVPDKVFARQDRRDIMLFVVLFFLVISSVVVVFLRRDKQTKLLLGLCISFVCMFVGIIIYLAKTGGLQTGQKFLLFLIPGFSGSCHI